MFRNPKDFKVRKQEIDRKEIIGEYFCDLCDQGPWPHETDVDFHRKKSHKWTLLRQLKNETGNMCSICLREQKDKKTLIEHILEHHYCSPANATRINRKIYICDYCQRLFFNKELLISHMYHWHIFKGQKSSQKVSCPKCSKTVRATNAWFHLLYHGALRPSTCPICLCNCQNVAEMREHIKTHPSSFVCNICGYLTNKECYLVNHLAKHKKNLQYDEHRDVSRFFLPEKHVLPCLKNSMSNIFKGIPMTNEIRICILCQALCFSKEEMRQHIYGEHAPDEVIESKKTYKCSCGEEFFNNVLLKHHIFKMKGNHQVWDGITPIMETPEVAEEQIVYQVYEINEPISIDVSEIILSGLGNQDITEVVCHVNRPLLDQADLIVPEDIEGLTLITENILRVGSMNGIEFIPNIKSKGDAMFSRDGAAEGHVVMSS